jgi:HEAT repeat protein
MESHDFNISELEQNKDLTGLIEALKHPDEWVRVSAANVLGRVGDERVIRH